VPVRDSKRRGEGWLAGYADIGWSNRLGWYEGFCLLTAVDLTGVITGFGFGPASTKDQQMAETFFALRHQPDPRLPSVGSFLAASEPRYYVVDKGFERARTLTKDGPNITEQGSSVLPSATVASRGPKR
jgi:hypothetical protein